MNIPRMRTLSARLRSYRGGFDLGIYESENCRCTAGVAMRTPEFNIVGFVPSEQVDGNAIPYYANEYGLHALAAFLEIPFDEVVMIGTPTAFMDGRLRTAKQVAMRVDVLIDAEMRRRAGKATREVIATAAKERV